MASEANSLVRDQRTACIFCHDSKKKDLKFLWCLHRTCGGCLDENVTKEGIVKCPNCLAVSQPAAIGRHLHSTLPRVRTLTKCASPSQAGSAQSATTILCDMCEMEQEMAASGQCMDCGMKLCPQHSTKHPLARLYRGHSVQELSTGGGVSKAAGSSVNCDLHPSLALTCYCIACSQLLCDKCAQGHVSGHDVQSMQDAASGTRLEIGKLFARADVVDNGSTASSHPAGTVPPETLESKVSEQIGDIRAELGSINDGVVAVSEDIETHFDSLRKSLAERERVLLSNVDEIGQKQSKQLEQKQQMLQESLDRYRAAKDVAECCAGDASDADVLRVAPMISEAVRELCTAVAERKYRPSSLCRPALYVPRHELTATLDQIEHHGEVQDVGIDLEASSIYGTNYSHSNGGIGVYISAKDHAHTPLRGEAVKLYLKATLRDPHGEVKELEIREDLEERLLHISERPVMVGDYLLEVTAGCHHFPGSPMTIRIGNELFALNSRMASSRLVMSNDCLRAGHVARDGNAVVVGTVGFKDCDDPIWAVQITGLGNGYMFIGVTTLPLPKSGFDLDRCRQVSSGWTSKGQGYKKHALSASGSMQEWKNGDRLLFMLCCKTGSLAVRNVSQDKDKVAVLTGVYDRQSQEGPLYFFAYLHDATHSIELIPC